MGLRPVTIRSVPGLALADHRVADPEAVVIGVHGGLDRGGSFARLARYTSRFDTVTYDRRGYQASRALQPLGLDQHIADLVAIVDHEAPSAPVILFGHSYGGVIALGAAVERPRSVQLVVVYETPFPWVMAREGAEPPPTADPAVEAERFYRRVALSRPWETLTRQDRRVRQLDGVALLADLATLYDGSALPFAIEDLQVTTLYVHGDVLHYDYHRALSLELVRRYRVFERTELAATGHAVHLLRPEMLADLISETWDRTRH